MMPGLFFEASMPRCIDPVLCYDAGPVRKFRHFSLSTPMFKALHNRVFNCGKCIFCRKRRSAELAVRCVLHSSLYRENCFLTLTYDEQREGYHNVFDYRDIQLFKKSFRQAVNSVEYSHFRTRKVKRRRVDDEFYRRVQLFNVHEYGKNGKKHWHLVCFNFDFADKVYMFTRNGNRLYRSDFLDSIWGHGHCTIGEVTEASAMYTAQYTQKDFQYGHVNNEFASHSKHSGIGRDYFLRHYSQILRLGYVPFQGRKVPVPRYFVRLAHRHFSHFYEPVNFEDTSERRALYRPFGPDEACHDIAQCYVIFQALREDFIRDITDEWEAFIDQSLFSKEVPDFKKSGDNYLYDLSNKISMSEF